MSESNKKGAKKDKKQGLNTLVNNNQFILLFVFRQQS